MRNLAIGVLLVSLMAGCSALVPTESQKSQSVKATEALAAQSHMTIRRALETGPSATTNSVPIREHLEIEATTSQDAGTRSSASGFFSSTIPAGVKLAILAVALGMLGALAMIGWRYLKSTALGQAISLADDHFAARIRALRQKAQTSLDPMEIAKVTTEIADLESDRGKLKTKR